MYSLSTRRALITHDRACPSHSVPDRAYGYPLWLASLVLCLALLPTVAFAADNANGAHLGQVCFAVADERYVSDQDPDNNKDTLTRLDPATGQTQIIGLTGTNNVEALSFGPKRKLYAANGGQIGTLDPFTGHFTKLPQALGTAGGAVGEFTLNDSDGLAFSLTENILFGTQRRFDGSPSGPKPDLLFAIDPTTGAHIPDYFGPEGGPKTDYVLVPAVMDDENVPLNDLDDIQFDPTNGILYGIMNTDGRSGVLITIDIATGASTPIATFRNKVGGDVIDDVEGISFGNDGTLYASTGDNYVGDFDDLNTLFDVDPLTGLGTLVGPFPTGPKDYEGLACLSLEAAIVLQKSTNGTGQAPDDADLPTGPLIDVGTAVTWTYTFTNTGVLTLTNLSLIDDQEGVIGPDGASNCPPAGAILGPGLSLTCTTVGVAQPGQYTNTATIFADTLPDEFFPTQTISEVNPSHYFGVGPGITPAIEIVKFTNGEDADAAPGPQILVGDPVTWTYQVRNTGDVPLSNVTVTDDKLAVAPTYVSGDMNSNSLLDLDETWLFQATGVAVAGQYENTGTVTGTPPTGPNVDDDNPSHYVGIAPGIEIVKFTNEEDADAAPGPQIRVGDAVTWTYQVRNTGGLPLSNITVTDDKPGVTPTYASGDSNNNNVLDVSEIWVFQATGVAVEGQYENMGTVTGTPPTGPDVDDDNPSHYFGITPGIEIVKFTNGEDADSAPGPQIVVGAPVTWTYQVRNTGNVALSNVSVTDDKLAVAPVYVSGDSNNNSLLDLDETWLFQATGTAVAGQYENTGTVKGTPPVGPDVDDDNPSHYSGVGPGIEIVKFTNGEDADAAPGPQIVVGDPVTWTYQVRNTGDVALSGVVVTDDKLAVAPAYVSGDANTNSLLDVGETWLFRATGIAVAGQYENTGTVTGAPPSGPEVDDDNPSHYFGVGPGIEIVKFTNGEDADVAPGPQIQISSTVTWTYEVRNTGNVPLSNVSVTDDKLAVAPVYVEGDSNGNQLLDLTETWLFQATGIALEGQYENTGTVTGTPPSGPNVSDSNPSHYFGEDLTGPTNLPEEEQPQQPQQNGALYLPSVRAE